MVYTTNNLIADSFYASGVVAREFETVSGSQVADGLQWLNDVLADKRIDQGMVPYETRYVFNSQVGVSTYFIPNLIQIDTIVFFLNSVRYAMQYEKRNQFFGSSRVNNISSLPFTWYFERQVGGGNLHIYFSPDQNYPIEIRGVFNVNSVKLGQDLSANVATADLGVPTFFGTGSIAPGQFVVNGIDLFGVYSNIGAFVNYINSGVIPGVRASMVVNNFVLSSTTEPPVNISVQSGGFTLANEVGTSFIGNVAAASTADVPAFYNNGSAGIGATLTLPFVNIPLVLDGYTVQLNDRVLIKNQYFNIPLGLDNGSYILTQQAAVGLPWILTRTGNYDQSAEINVGNLFTVLNGTVNVGDTFIQTEQVSVIGTSPILFSLFNSITFSNFSTINTPGYDVFIPLGMDQFYISYLRYALADRICSEYSIDVPPGVAKQLAEYQSWIKKKSRIIDLRMEKSSTMQRRGGYGWCYVNLGRGWVSSDYY